MDNGIENKHKAHRERKSGPKAAKKQNKKNKSNEQAPIDHKGKNPKAFGCLSAVKAQRQTARSQDLNQKRIHIPVVDRTPLQPPPLIVAVVGGPSVGKSTLLQALIKNFTKQKLSQIKGPVTIVTGKKIRLTFIEVNSDIQCMIDAAKIADVVLMLIDVTKGIEMEIMEFFEICRSHGSPKILGVINHLDVMKDNKSLKNVRKELKHRFQVELYPGAKVFCLSGFKYDEYLKTEINILSRYITIQKIRPLHYRSTHPYVLVDRIEDITNAEEIRRNSLCDRKVVLYGYVRGIPMKKDQPVHIPGVGDFRVNEISFLDDPCPLPGVLKKRSLNAKERILYAPMSGVAGVVYDDDAVYIDLGGSHHMQKKADDEDDAILEPLLQLQKTTDEKRDESQFKLFSHSKPITNDEVTNGEGTIFESEVGIDGRIHRKVIFNNEIDVNGDDDEEESEDETDLTLNGDSSDEVANHEDEPPAKRLKKDNEYDPISIMRNAIKKNNPEQNVSRTMPIENSCDDKKFKNLALKSDLPGIDTSLSGSDFVAYYRDSIYGDVAEEHDGKEDSDDEGDEFGGGLFKKSQSMTSKMNYNEVFHQPDSMRSKRTQVQQWGDSSSFDLIKDSFVTGEWGDKEDAKKLLKMDEEEIYGDYEDMETGEKVSGSKEDGIEENGAEDSKEKTEEEKRLEKKIKLKEALFNEYDGKGADHYDMIKEEMAQQSQLNKTQFEELDDEARVQYEGYRAGLYVRMVIHKMYAEFVTNFDPKYHIIVGGLLDSEINKGFVKGKLKVHRWFPRILKNRDPLTISLGWRRFQTMVYYAKREDNFRYRSLKYARKFLHVEAFFWGPMAETSSGFVAIQHINGSSKEFGIAATGVIQDNDQSTRIMKKLKFLGYPKRVYQKTAFIKDMFHSDTEVAKFGGVKIQTQSLIRGIVKKADGRDGDFRATFEDKIKMSDTIILKTWAVIEVAQFCSYIRNYLLKDKTQWNGLKTNAQKKRELSIRSMPIVDSLYTDVKSRREYVEMPLKISKQLQKSLPYKDKPKITLHQKKEERVLVVKDPEEVELDSFIGGLKVVMKDRILKQKAEKAKQQQKFIKQKQDEEGRMNIRMKKVKSAACKRIQLTNKQKKH